MLNTHLNRALWLIAVSSIGLIAFALYLQHVKALDPCPLCVMQRYAFLALAIVCVVGALTPWKKASLFAGMLTAATGAGIAIYHLWIKAHPHTSCGIDPLETSLNKIWPAQWLPSVFKADGLCSADLPPVLGLSIPLWSLIWFVIFLAGTALLLSRLHSARAR